MTMLRRNPFAGALVPAAAIALALFAIFGDEGNANQPAGRGAAPTAVAVVNIRDVINDLDEMEQRQQQLQELVDERNATIDQLVQEGEILAEDLNNENLPRERELEIRGRLLELRELIPARQQINQEIVSINIGRAFKEMYEKALATIEFVSERDGWELVVLDDSAIEFPTERQPNEGMASEIIQRRKILHVVSRIDISDTIIDQMNNDFAAGIDRAGGADQQ